MQSVELGLMSFGAECMINCAAVAHKLDVSVQTKQTCSIMLRDTVFAHCKASRTSASGVSIIHVVVVLAAVAVWW